MLYVLLPSLPPRWQRCPPEVGDPPIVSRRCERKESSHSILPLCSPDMCPRVSLGYTKTKGVFASNYSVLDPRSRRKSEKAKAPLRPPYKRGAVEKRRRSGLNFGWLGTAIARGPPALGSAVRLAFVPSLGAKYLAMPGGCQEKMCCRPQNIWSRVSAMSTGSGAYAEGHNGSFCRKLRGGSLR